MCSFTRGPVLRWGGALWGLRAIALVPFDHDSFDISKAKRHWLRLQAIIAYTMRNKALIHQLSAFLLHMYLS